MQRTRQILSLLALVALALTTAGCNTVEGAGKDIKSAGAEIEEAARDARN
jgi:predicted small secreted protein